MTHRHTAECWDRYEPCGEHHAHGFNCGDGELAPSCPLYEQQRNWRVNDAARDVGELLDRRFGWRNGELKEAVLDKAKKMVKP